MSVPGLRLSAQILWLTASRSSIEQQKHLHRTPCWFACAGAVACVGVWIGRGWCVHAWVRVGVCERVCVICCYVRCSEVRGARGPSIQLMKGPLWRRQETPEKWRCKCLKSADPCHTDVPERSRRGGDGDSPGPQGLKQRALALRGERAT